MSHSQLFEITDVLDSGHPTNIFPYQDISVNTPRFFALAILIGLTAHVMDLRTDLCQVLADKDWVRRRCCCLHELDSFSCRENTAPRSVGGKFDEDLSSFVP